MWSQEFFSSDTTDPPGKALFPGVRRGSDAGFVAFADAAMPMLYRLALATCRDQRRADDLVQTTLEKMWLAWPRLTDVDDLYAYARRVLVNAFYTEHRRPWWRREHVVTFEYLDLFDHAPDQLTPVVAQLDLIAGLRQLPERQRMAVVLRYLEDLTVADVAGLMTCSEGNVKRLSFDGLRTLRTVMSERQERTPT